MIMIEDNKSKYKHVYYFYANIARNKVIELGYYHHKSNLRHILRKHFESPIMNYGKDEIRRSFDFLFRFLERVGYVDRNLGLSNNELAFFKGRVIKMNVDEIDKYIDYYNFNLEKLRP